MIPSRQNNTSQSPEPPSATAGPNGGNGSDTEASPVFGLNSLKATAVQNLEDFTVPMWDLLTDGLENHKPATGIKDSFYLRNDTATGLHDIQTYVHPPDQRKAVNPVHFAPGGKYRSVVKLSLVFRRRGSDVRMMGTGWMISNNILVTAGHCVYDKAYKMGQVKSIVAYLGYQGVGSIDGPYSNVEIAYGKVVATTTGWIRNLGNVGRQYDIAWVRLDRKFQEIGDVTKAIKWSNTPFQGNNSMLGVVGYPGDKELDGEHGAEMYECWMPTTFDLTKDNMIQYEIDTSGGQSGSPVFYSLNAADISLKDNAPYPGVKNLEANAIGVHTYGGQASNSGTPIGPFGNPMSRYLQVVVNQNLKLTKEIRYVPETPPQEGQFDDAPLTNGFDPVVSLKDGAYEVKVPFANEEFGLGDILSIGTKVLGGFFESSFEDPTITDEAAVEGFFDFLGKAAKTIGSVALPMVLGPAGVPASMVANAAITVLGRALEKKSSGAEVAEADTDTDHKKKLYRAALSDAVFDACCKHHKILNEEGFFDTLKKWIPTGVKVATTIGSALGDYAKNQGNTQFDFEALKDQGYTWEMKYKTWAWDTQPICPDAQENPAGQSLGEAFNPGKEYTEFIQCMGEKDYFPGINWSKLKDFTPKSRKSFAASLAEQSPTNALTDNMQIANTMRALTGEMVLSAIENATPSQLKAVDQEGFFADATAALKKTLGKFGKTLIKNGPDILDAVNNIVQSKVAGSSGAGNNAAVAINGKNKQAATEGASDRQEGTESAENNRTSVPEDTTTSS